MCEKDSDCPKSSLCHDHLCMSEYQFFDYGRRQTERWNHIELMNKLHDLEEQLKELKKKDLP